MEPKLVTISGMDETLELLTSAPKNIVMLGYARAARAAINVMATALVARTPIDQAASKKKGRTGKAWHDKSRAALVKSVKIDVTVDSSAKGVSASVGFSGIHATIANALEYGHAMVTHEGETVGEEQPHPFMRPAFDASADAAIDAFTESLTETLKEAY
jgi:hypothetical protein